MRVKRFIASCFGLGRLPAAPGTWGSIPPAAVFALLLYFNVSAVAILIVMTILVCAGSIICIVFAPSVAAKLGKPDPSEVVADEFAGQALTFLIVMFWGLHPSRAGEICVIAVSGFVLFRLFDIVKPWPIRKFENLPKGWGILADDLVAGLCASVALLLSVRLGIVAHFTGMFHFEKSSLSVLQAAFLGAVQGFTEFLPVSSSGHLVLFETMFHLEPERPEMLLFDLTTHLGTLVAIGIVFRQSIADFLRNLLASDKYGTTLLEVYKKSPSVHFLTLGIVATFVTGVLGLLFENYFKAARGNLAVVALMWAITGTLLLVTDWRKRPKIGLRQFTVPAAVLVGIAQAVAIMPGISRSGMTICIAILIGLRRRWAVEFSFLIAIPAILGAAAIQLSEGYTALSSGSLPTSSVLAGSVVAAVTGVVALKLLIRAIRTAKLKFFAFYCYILVFIVLIYFLR